MERIREWSWPVVLVLSVVFLVTIVGCKTAHSQKDYDESPYEPEPDPEPGPGPHPPSWESR